MRVPASPSDITPEWLTAALAPHLDGTTVVGIDVHDIGEGTGIFGEIARLRLTYDRPDRGAPASLIAKLPCVEPENLAVAKALGIYEREVHFFDDVAPTTPLRVPDCYLAELDDDGRFVLLLEDLEVDLDVGDQVVGATVEQAEAVIDALVELHAPWWETGELYELDWLPVPDAPEYMAAVPGIYRAGLPVLEAEWSDRLPAGSVDVARTLDPEFEGLMRRMAEGPRTFAHADTRLDNIFFARDGSGSVAFIDFQLCLRQRGVADLAYLIGTSMNVADSRGSWERLLRRWYHRLGEHGVTGYAWDDCLRQYKESALYYLCGAMSLIGSFDTGNERGAAMATAYTTRIFGHVLDLDAASVL